MPVRRNNRVHSRLHHLEWRLIWKVPMVLDRCVLWDRVLHRKSMCLETRRLHGLYRLHRVSHLMVNVAFRDCINGIQTHRPVWIDRCSVHVGPRCCDTCGSRRQLRKRSLPLGKLRTGTWNRFCNLFRRLWSIRLFRLERAVPCGSGGGGGLLLGNVLSGCFSALLALADVFARQPEFWSLVSETIKTK